MRLFGKANRERHDGHSVEHVRVSITLFKNQIELRNMSSELLLPVHIAEVVRVFITG